MSEQTVGRVVLQRMVSGLLAAGYPVRTRYGKGRLVYMGPTTGYSLAGCREYCAAADTWRVRLRHGDYDFGRGKWLMPPGVPKPTGHTNGRGMPVVSREGYRLELTFAPSEAEEIADWTVSYIVARERGEEPVPCPGDAGRWPPSVEYGYLWTRAAEALQDEWSARRKAYEAARAARLSRLG